MVLLKKIKIDNSRGEMSDRSRSNFDIVKNIKTYKISLPIYDFIDFWGSYKDINKYSLHDQIFEYSLNKMPKTIGNTIVIRQNLKDACSKKFAFSDHTYKLFYEKYNHFKKVFNILGSSYLPTGVFMDLIIYFWMKKHISKSILKNFDFKYSFRITK